MEPLISVIIWTYGTSHVFFKECMDSLAAQNYGSYEILIMDENEDDGIAVMLREFIAQDKRIRYRKLGHGTGMAYALNTGIHHSKGDLIFIMGQHDRLDERMLTLLAEAYNADPMCDVIYTDHDELQGLNRTNPHFKPDFSPELLRHINYIGDFVALRRESIKSLGTFRETLTAAGVYEFLLRTVEKKAVTLHIPKLLYHLRITSNGVGSSEIKKAEKKAYREYMTVAEAHIRRMGLTANVEADKKLRFWKIDYDGSDYRNHHKEYILIREDGVKVISHDAAARMFGILRQPDVGIVGGKVLKRGFRIDNCGYIFDRGGIAYPACHNLGSNAEGYDYRCVIPREVSMVDPGYCMIDARFYRRAGGFDPALTGRDLMLDLCMKARRAGLRVIYDPFTLVKRGDTGEVSSKDSNELLMRRWGDVIDEGDPYYNKNLPTGLENYFLY
ncbi:MAG: glycosyltransferase [Lachnospiraceae bacterium]|nr:glycosyltransferase [Lachnospiraceae bacterium]